MVLIPANKGRQCLAVLVLCACALMPCSCADPEMRVTFEIPEDYRDMVTSISLQILMPPKTEPFGCDDLAFGTVGLDVLRLSLFQEVFITGKGEIPLAGIDRRLSKVLLARGFDEYGDLVVTACAAVGEVVGDMHVRMKGEPVAVVRLPGGNVLIEDENSEGGIRPVNLLATDGRARPLVGVETRWTVVGPGGSTVTGVEFTDDLGQVDLIVEMPSLTGPLVLEVAVRWQRGGTTLIRGFKRPRPISLKLPGSCLRAIDVGRIGPGGQTGFLAVTDSCSPDAQSSYFAYHYYDKSAKAMSGGDVEIGIGGAMLALGVVPGEAGDRLLVVSNDVWWELDPENIAFISHDFVSASPGKAPEGVFPVGPCALEGPHSVLVRFKDGTVGVYAPEGGEPVPVLDNPFASLSSGQMVMESGCVSDQTTEEKHRVLVLSVDHNGQEENELVIDSYGALSSVELPALISDVGFSPALGREPAMLMVSHLGVDGPELSRLKIRLMGSGQEPLLEEVTRDHLIGAPISVGGGDIDGDGIIDVVGLIPVTFSGETAQFYLQATLGCEHRGKRVSGLMLVGSSFGSFVNPRIWLTDFDGNGVDDIVLVKLDGHEGDSGQAYNWCVDIFLMGAEVE